jgi:predicted ATPase
MLGDSLYWQGRFREALTNVEQAVAVYRPALGVVNFHGWDSAVLSFMYIGLCYWQLGYPNRDVPMILKASERATSINHTATTGIARMCGCLWYLLRRDSAAAEREADLMASLFTGLDATAYQPLYRALQISASLQREPTRAALEELSEIVKGMQIVVYKLALTPMLAALAEGYGEIKDTDAGLATISDALSLIEETSERVMEAEFHRLKGELLSATEHANLAEVEVCFNRAIEISHGQEAKSFELRATTSLARLLQKQGRRDEARTMLAAIYNWFTEGFDTADLKDAKALLEELQARPVLGEQR